VHAAPVRPTALALKVKVARYTRPTMMVRTVMAMLRACGVCGVVAQGGAGATARGCYVHVCKPVRGSATGEHSSGSNGGGTPRQHNPKSHRVAGRQALRVNAALDLG
jgi:hypothetical protein